MWGRYLEQLVKIDQVTSKPKEIKTYNPPKKKSKSEPKLFEDNKTILSKVTSEPKSAETVLKLEEESVDKDEDPLILNETHEEVKEVLNNLNPKEDEIKISPAARKLANEASVNINDISGSGKNGVILKEDIMSLMGSKPSPRKERLNTVQRKE